MPTEEQNRLRRLRDTQLGARDPLAKQRRLDREISQKQRRMRESFSFGRMWADLPHSVRSAFVGGLIGLVILLVAPALIEGTWGVCLGAFAYDAVSRLTGLGPRPRFGHGVEARLPDGCALVCSYHPSQQNTFTGRLTEEMFDEVFRRARELAGDGRARRAGR